MHLAWLSFIGIVYKTPRLLVVSGEWRCKPASVAEQACLDSKVAACFLLRFSVLRFTDMHVSVYAAVGLKLTACLWLRAIDFIYLLSPFFYMRCTVRCGMYHVLNFCSEHEKSSVDST